MSKHVTQAGRSSTAGRGDPAGAPVRRPAAPAAGPAPAPVPAPRAAREPAPLSLPVRRAAADCLKAIGHPVRLRMVELLLAGELNVNELAAACRVTQPVASTHLRFLQRCRLFAAERRGKSVFYRVSEPGVADLLALIRRRFTRLSAAP